MVPHARCHHSDRVDSAPRGAGTVVSLLSRHPQPIPQTEGARAGPAAWWH